MNENWTISYNSDRCVAINYITCIWLIHYALFYVMHQNRYKTKENKILYISAMINLCVLNNNL